MTSHLRRSFETCGKNVWHLYRNRCVCNHSVAVEGRTAKLLWYDNRLSVGTNILSLAWPDRYFPFFFVAAEKSNIL